MRRIGTNLALCGLLALLTGLSACNMPGRRTPTPSGFEMINTAAAMTVAAQLTEVSKPPAATPQTTLQPGQRTPVLTAGANPTLPGPANPTLAGSQAPVFTLVPQPTPAPQAGACDRAKFVKDVTVADNSQMQPGESFTKTWRLKNVGQCTWDNDYALVFVGGDPLGSPGSVNFAKAVEPNETVDLSVEMVAPTTGGTYRSEWKLSNPTGEVFGTGSKADQPVWAQIRVNAPAGEGAGQFDFVSSASSATWYSAAGDNAGLPLVFGGSPDDPGGAAILADGLALENGKTSGKVLLTVPRQQEDGYVYGIFPFYQIQTGDHFKARVGFAANSDGRCGEGKAIFQVAVKDGADISTLQEVSAACDGSLTPIDLDLSALRGRSLQFILAVRAAGSPQDDWAVWNSPQITSK
jgi:hypothetical protein